jgi:hypothetical protein
MGTTTITGFSPGRGGDWSPIAAEPHSAGARRGKATRVTSGRGAPSWARRSNARRAGGSPAPRARPKRTATFERRCPVPASRSPDQARCLGEVVVEAADSPHLQIAPPHVHADARVPRRRAASGAAPREPPAPFGSVVPAISRCWRGRWAASRRSPAEGSPQPFLSSAVLFQRDPEALTARRAHLARPPAATIDVDHVVAAALLASHTGDLDLDARGQARVSRSPSRNGRSG